MILMLVVVDSDRKCLRIAGVEAHHVLYLDLPGNAINQDMQYPIIPRLTSPGRLGARAPELSDIAK